jgi:hypothetical protein
MYNMKKEFLLKEIWMLSISAAFGRANVYNKDCKSDKIKNEFKKKLSELIIEITKDYKGNVDEETHLENIIKVSELEDDCLANGKLNYGVSQKLLNLYLKYLWCLDLIPMPPHFPVDRKIQVALKQKTIISWTKDMNKVNYMEIIKVAKQKAEGLQNVHIAELELKLFNRI